MEIKFIKQLKKKRAKKRNTDAFIGGAGWAIGAYHLGKLAPDKLEEIIENGWIQDGPNPFDKGAQYAVELIKLATGKVESDVD